MNPFNYDIQALEQKARTVRRHIIRLNADSPAGGHTGADLSQTDLLTALYFRILNVSADRLEDKNRDIYIQSKGHAVGCYYCVLAEAGYFSLDWLATYQHSNSHLPGHPVRQKTPGIELNTGALGHGFPIAVGLALAAKKDNSLRRIFLITGDGELAEGSNWEAALAAAHYKLDNLVIINDKNNLQLAGATKDIMNTDPLADKWRAFGMQVSECEGNNMASIVSTLEGLKQEGKPNVVIAHTTKGAGVSFIAGKPEWHHRVPKGEEIELAMEELKDE
ncbi:TPA: transketolase [Salmonella enterica subsp. enterica serovar Enteritidis]|uniref:transketolase n=1 Tax=Salmonella enterica TaxID=28901 RepID=UPI0002A6BE21|nr:transketolase [Salmonella enterica]ECF1699892.1 transketolase [Salmonella enterica subsp. enterica]ECG5955118.1 transketolase [Salmonella enterica subsp. enterica serovar Baguida]EDS4737531.1 transketolase [Salmonella enterica subsp. enterica serovar Oranienburg]EDU6361458.1 transketolase [Salmonella enterica subsp. enterica serovar Florian]EGX8053458.1 transketolase [Salmonella enterica subsp. enterica serovar Inganda]ELO82089.1 transketolase domain-containing protein [Salmonella enterica